MAQQTTSKESGSSESTELSGSTVAARGIKIAGEALVAPGSSLILDGKILAGGLHLVGGLLARCALGPLGWFLVAANSYSKSVAGRNLYEYLGNAKKE